MSASTIKKYSMVTHGSHEPSGVDTTDWRRWLSNVGQSSTTLCVVATKFARRLATNNFHDGSLMPYNACCLIFLDKNPGARPIDVAVFRRIIGTNILRCVSNELNTVRQYDENELIRGGVD